MNTEKVSMVMACYNSEPYLDKMLNSILEQSYDNIELITVNGSSTDRTEEKLLEWKSKFKQKGYELIYKSLPDSNLVEALNEGLKHISGEYVCFPDSDDWMHPEFCSALVNLLKENPQYGWAKCDAALTDEDGNIIGYRVSKQSKPEIDNCLIRFIAELDTIDAWIIMARYDYLKKCLPDLKMVFADSHEFQLSLPMSFYGDFIHTNQLLYHNIRHYGSGYYRSISSYSNATTYYKRYMSQVIKIMQTLPLNENDRERYLKAFKLRFMRTKYQIALMYNEMDAISELSEEFKVLVDESISCFDCPDVKTYLEIACIILQDYLLGITWGNGKNNYNKLKKSEFIVYGAGMKCLENLPALIEIGLIPKEVWDIGAKQGDTIKDVPLKSVSTLQTIGINIQRNRSLFDVLEHQVYINKPFSNNISLDTPILMMINSGPIEQSVILTLHKHGFKYVIPHNDTIDMIRYGFAISKFPSLVSMEEK